MNSHCDQDNGDRFSDTVLEEYALGRLGEELSEEFRLHLRRCQVCTTRLNVVQREVADVTKLLEAGVAAPDGTCLDDETLAMYLDQALEEHGRNRVEEHLSGCRSCRDRLVRVYRDLQEALRWEAPIAEENEKPAVGQEAAATAEAGTARGPIAFPRGPAPGRLSARAAVPAMLGIAAVAGAALSKGRAVLPLQFLALGCLSFTLVEVRAAGKGSRTFGRRLVHTLLGVLAAVLFGLSFLSPGAAGWYLTGAAACCLPLLLGRAATTVAPGKLPDTRPLESETGSLGRAGGERAAVTRAEKRKQ